MCKLCAGQVAAFSCSVGAGALEIVCGVVKRVIMWIPGDGAESHSRSLTRSDIILGFTLLILTTGGLLTLHLLETTHLVYHVLMKQIIIYYILL